MDDEKIKVINLEIKQDGDFDINNFDFKKAIFVPSGLTFYSVDLVFSLKDIDHDEIAKIYVKTRPDLQKGYERFKKKTGNISYKDFLLFEEDSISVFNEHNKKEIISTLESNNRSMRGVLNSCLNNGYKYLKPEIQEFLPQKNY